MSIVKLKKAIAPQGTMLETGVHSFWSWPCPSAGFLEGNAVFSASSTNLVLFPL